MTRSFDVFDTLLARRYIDSKIIWNTLENQYEIVGFMQARMDADTGNRNLKGIYNALIECNVLTEDKAYEVYTAELKMEKSLAFPIKENIDKVRNGDILVSDMYLHASEILDLTRSIGMDKQVSIYQSNGDKSTGAFWSKMQGKLDLEYHLGDNINSDVNKPSEYGFNSVHYPNTTSLTQIEDLFINNGMTHLGLLIRETRLMDYSSKYGTYLDIANQKNLPWLFVACELLYRKYNNKEIVFLGRDCQLLYKVYSAYFNARAQYLPFSREVALNQPREATEYIKHYISNDSILVDISSTGKTWEIICGIYPFNVEVFIHSDLYWYSSSKPVTPNTFTSFHKNSVIGGTSIIIEIFNCGDHGKLRSIDMIEGLPVGKFSNVAELPNEIIDIIHRPVNNAIELRLKGHYAALTSELSKVDTEILLSISANLLVGMSSIDKTTLNIINLDDGKYIMDEFDKKESEYLNNVSLK